eukprot:12913427-Prorocentrum_lima.AAC.1
MYTRIAPTGLSCPSYLWKSTKIFQVDARFAKATPSFSTTLTMQGVSSHPSLQIRSISFDSHELNHAVE